MAISVDKSGAFGAEYVVTGLDVALQKLAEVDAKAVKEIRAHARKISRSVRDKAEGSVHRRAGRSGRWYGTRSGRDRFRVVSANAPASIFEFAATPHCRQGASLISTLNAQYGAPGRIMWEAFDSMRGEVDGGVGQIVSDAEQALRSI